MSEKNKKKPLLESESLPDAENVEEFSLDEFKIHSISSAATIKKQAVPAVTENTKDVLSAENDVPPIVTDKELKDEKDDSAGTEDPVFKQLAEPKLPVLRTENRARLQMQSPTRLHFYWAVKGNPFETLSRVFGSRASSYTLVVKLLNQTNNREEIFPVAAEGSWWFDVDADANYRAEIGFYAANRPFVRVMFSNIVETPRRNPSPRNASDADWAVSADYFAQVLDNAGFTQDAFEVALAGDDAELAEIATRSAFANIVGETENDDFSRESSSEMRFALLALASGYSLEDLREHVSPGFFAKLQSLAENLSAEKALVALQENFGVFTDENAETEMIAPTVFGASLINFPRRRKRFFKQNTLPKFSPVSSFKVERSFR